MAAEGAEQLPLAYLAGETGAAGDVQTGAAIGQPAGGAGRARAAGRAADALPPGSGGGCVGSGRRSGAGAHAGRHRLPAPGAAGARFRAGGAAGCPSPGAAGSVSCRRQGRGRPAATGPHGGPPGPGARGGQGARIPGDRPVSSGGRPVVRGTGAVMASGAGGTAAPDRRGPVCMSSSMRAMRRNCSAAQSREPSAGSSSLPVCCVRRRWNCSRDRCVHVGYSLSEDGHGVPRRMAAEKLCCPKVFFLP